MVLAVKRSVVRCLSLSVTVRVPSTMPTGSSASSLTVTFWSEPLRLVTSSAMAAWSPGVMKRGVFSSATIGAATTISASVLP
ncbi:Uncharacterised protein [Achromobacter xylosoxidans]|nr:Uncharacterised protein [Achromobacter xylosoxidans]